jgi:hypothetical protein
MMAAPTEYDGNITRYYRNGNLLWGLNRDLRLRERSKHPQQHDHERR